MKMKLFASFLIVFVSLVLAGCNPQSRNVGTPGETGTNGTQNKDAMPVISFENDLHDFGKIKSGERVTFAFKFKNTGKSDLVISNVSTSCGCTVSSYPKEPIKAGEESTIDISFNSDGKHGLQSKSITVYSNTEPATSTLRIQASIVEPEDM
jgi:hypothetical protein